MQTLSRGLAPLAAVFLPLALAACGGSAPIGSRADEGWTSQEFPAEGRADVRAYYEAIEKAVADGTAVTLPTLVHDSELGADAFGDPQDLSFKLQRSDLLDPNAFFEINGTPAKGPFIRVYAGHVDGQEDQIAHVVVAQDFIRGAVRIDDRMNVIRIAMRGNRPLDMPRKPQPPEEAPVDRPPTSPEPSTCPTDMFANVGGVRGIPPYENAEYALGLATGPVLKSRVILDADWKAIQAWGRFMPAMMVGMIAETDLTFRNQVGIHHTIVGLHQNTIESYYPNTVDVDPFAEMAMWWDVHHPERDIVHLFSGWDTGYAQANCIGGAGTPAGYAFSPTPWEDDGGFFNENVTAHEWGHLYSAHHHYGNHVESDLATIMIMGYTPGSQPIFGTVEKTVIRGWAEEYLEPWPGQ